MFYGPSKEGIFSILEEYLNVLYRMDSTASHMRDRMRPYKALRSAIRALNGWSIPMLHFPNADGGPEQICHRHDECLTDHGNL